MTRTASSILAFAAFCLTAAAAQAAAPCCGSIHTVRLTDDGSIHTVRLMDESTQQATRVADESKDSTRSSDDQTSDTDTSRG